MIILQFLHEHFFRFKYSGFLQQKGVVQNTKPTDFSIETILEKQLDEQLDEQLEQLERHGEHESEENSSILVREMTEGSETSMDETLSQQLAKIDSTDFDTPSDAVQFQNRALHREYDACDRHELEGERMASRYFYGFLKLVNEVGCH